MEFIEVVSLSGGRSSGKLAHLMEERRKAEGITVKYLFMDTGAEHPKTYEFIRNIVKHFKIDLVCLRLKVNPVLGQANTYEIVKLEDCKHDLQPWGDVAEKYGTPYNPGGAFCTWAMKTDIYDKYCDKTFGRLKYNTWLGIREDEPKRLKPVGERLSKKQALRYNDLKYLADISDFEKQDVLDWWKEQTFDLGIPEHLGNCVWCIKKGVNKVALAVKDEPLLSAQFQTMLNNPNIRVNENRKNPNEIMYRGLNSFGSIITTFKDISRDELASSLRYAKRDASGSCSESCEILNEEETEQMESFNGNTTTPADEANLAQTPVWFVEALEKYLRIQFDLDVCALAETAKCENYYSLVERGEDSLNLPWAKQNFCNPPFSDIMPWVDKAVVEAGRGNITAMLIPDKPEVGYIRKCRRFADTMIHMPFRLKFLRPNGEKFLDKKSNEQGPKFPVTIALFTPWGIGMPVRDVYVDFRRLM